MLNEWDDGELFSASEKLRKVAPTASGAEVVEAVTQAAETRGKDEGMESLIERAALILAARRAASAHPLIHGNK